MFFDRFGKSQSSSHLDHCDHRSQSTDVTVAGRATKKHGAPEETALRRRRALALGLAVNLALPVSLLSQLLSGARAGAAEPSGDPAGRTGSGVLPSRVVTGSRRAASNAPYPTAANQARAAVVMPAVPVLAAAEGPDQELFAKGVEQYKAAQYEEAATTLNRVTTESLSEADRKTLNDTLTKSQAAAVERKAARAEFELGQQALKTKQYNDAARHYKAASANGFADIGTRAKASEQLALAQSAAKDAGTDPASLYEKGVKAFKSNDYAGARQNLAAARDAGYKPGLFQDTPESMLAKIDAREPAGASPAPRPVAVVPAPSVGAPAPAPIVIAQVEPTPPVAPPDAATAPTPPEPTPTPPTPAPAPEAAPTPPTPPVEPTPTPTPTPPLPRTREPVAVEPSPAPSGDASDRALSAASNLNRIRQQQRVFQAQQLVNKARQQDANGQTNEAFNDYSKAAELDPNNQQATAGRDQLAQRLGRVPGTAGGINQFSRELNERKQAIEYSFSSNIDAANRAIEARDYEGAQRSIDRARISSNTDPTIFTQEQNNRFNTVLANTNAALVRARGAQTEVDARRTLDDSIRDQTERARQARLDRERTVAGLIQDARQYIAQGKYREALAVIDHIQALDPTNEYASSVRMLIEDKAATQEQRQYREEFNRQFTQQLNKTEERKIPYEDVLRYPSNWPEIAEMRDAQVKAERGENTEDAALQAQLDRKLPELSFNANSFSDVIDFLRDVTGSNIYVDWPALERASISRDAPVTARLRDIKFSKALQLIFKSVEGEEEERKLGYSIDEGVITISTRRELNKNVVTQRYDINDLLFVAPDYVNAPNLDITQAGGGGGGGGGRGGGGGGGNQQLFQNGNQGNQNQQEQAGQREARIDEIKKYIIDNVSSTTWKDNGGDVGSISSSPLRAVLLITQTAENHRGIVKVLDSLRASQALQVSIETRFLIVQRNYLEDIGVDADFTLNPLRNAADPRSGIWSSRFTPIPVIQNQVTDNTTFRDANGNIAANPAQGSRSLDWQSSVGNASVPGSIPANPADYPNPIVIQGSYLDSVTVNFLLRAVQANVQSTSLTAPRLTLFSGQRAVLIVQTQQAYVSDLTPVVAPGAALFDPQVSTTVGTGVVLNVLATVSPDRKYVYLDMQPQLARLRALVPFSISALVQPVAGPNGTIGQAQQVSGTLQLPTLDTTIVQTSCSVPDGATLLLGGQTLAGETTREQGVPVLSKIPFLKRLFTNRATANDEQILLILVKPTILIQTEQEQKQFPLLSTKVNN